MDELNPEERAERIGHTVTLRYRMWQCRYTIQQPALGDLLG